MGQGRGAYFEITEEGGRKVPHHPQLEESGGRTILREDVALFARAVNPFNRKRIVTICNGMYGRGTYGAVRALTDERFRDRNMEYIQARFPDAEACCILTRVTVENGVTLTPDWTLPGHGSSVVQAAVMAGIETAHHHGSHRPLIWPVDESTPPVKVDAIIVPTARPVAYLKEAAAAARSLGCPLVTLHSQRWTSAYAAAAHLDPAVDLVADRRA